MDPLDTIDAALLIMEVRAGAKAWGDLRATMTAAGDEIERAERERLLSQARARVATEISRRSAELMHAAHCRRAAGMRVRRAARAAGVDVGAWLAECEASGRRADLWPDECVRPESIARRRRRARRRTRQDR